MPVPILPVTLVTRPTAAPAASPSGGEQFASVLADAISKVQSFQWNAQQSVNRFLNGEGEEIHKVALASEQADLSFQLFVQVRNKVVSAYQEVMRMQI